MGRNVPYGLVFALTSVFLAIAHGQTLDRTHGYESSYDHGRGLEPDKISSGAKRIAAAPDHPSFEDDFARTSRFPHQAPSAAVRHARRAATEFLANSHEEMDSLTSFRANVSGGALAVFRSWNVNDSSPCTWAGVKCSEEQHVIALTLPSLRLQGSINSAMLALGNLQFLETLDLSDNNFSSSIPGSVLANFSGLVSLNLSYNQVTGEIPDQIGQLANCGVLDFQYNQLAGQLPPSICNCSDLRVLSLGSNFLRGPIPENIGRLTHLEKLVFGTEILNTNYLPPVGNSLSGSIPPSLGNCSLLSVLDTTYNVELGGQLPRELSQLQNLEKFVIPYCSFMDVFPLWIGNCTNLLSLMLDINHFHGPIPAEIGKLSKLEILQLGYNQLTGGIPPEIANCTSLLQFTTFDNSMTGVIPSGLSACKQINNLQLGANPTMRPGPIPAWIGSLTDLTVLDLSDMNLHGEIPHQYGSLQELTFLALYENWLSGSIPVSLLNCSNLQILVLGANNLTGPIPSAFGLLLPNLLNLNVQNNLLTGEIPSSMFNLTQLTILALGYNRLAGNLDRQWGMLPLTRLYLSENHFLGSLPISLSNCSNLRTLDFGTNDLTGEIPDSFGNFSQLGQLSLANNSLSGTIPAGVFKLSVLVYLDLSGNNLEGLLLPDLGGLVHVTNLYLGNNRLVGVIPNSLGNLTGVVELDVSYNRLTGDLPGQSLSRLGALTSIDISHNLFSGSLSADWGHLTELQSMKVSANNLSGSIPNLGALRSLQWLDISLNNFSGNIPDSLASLPNLTFFNASYNDLTGPIPTSGAFQSSITANSFVGNPGLCGAVLGPSRLCHQNVSQARSKRCHHRGHHLHCATTWIPIAVVGAFCIFVVVVVTVVMCLVMRRAPQKHSKEDTVFVKFCQDALKFTPSDILGAIRAGENVLSSTNRSIVYKGTLPGCNTVAIKAFVSQNEDGLDLRAMEQEARIQSNLRHRNVLKVLSFCSTADFRTLVLEYMPQGSLHDHLYPYACDNEEHWYQNLMQGKETRVCTGSCEFPWSVRLGIALDVAEGMTYLHHDFVEPVIHGDLKPSNVLLDDEMVAKIADFGISRHVNLQRGAELGEATASNIFGTVGYIPPEYAFAGVMSTKGDVFSYGVLLLEILTGRSPTATDLPSEAVYRDSNLQLFQGIPLDMFDPTLQEEGRVDLLTKKQMMLMARVAFISTRQSPQSRPSMKDVQSMLIQIKEVRVNATARQTMDELLLVDDSTAVVWGNQDPDDSTFPTSSG